MKAPTMRVLPTRYDGVLYRSRTEARWAVFFNAVGCCHQWEATGYDLAGLWYLPDFWLPTINTYLEVKGAKPTAEERRKSMLLSAATDSTVVVVSGAPEPRADDSDAVLMWRGGRFIGAATMAYCEPCGRLVFHSGGWDDRCWTCRRSSEPKHEKLIRSANIARSHRFETPERVPEIRLAYDIATTAIGALGPAEPDELQEMLEHEGFDPDSPSVRQAILDNCNVPRSEQ
jgi:hypothetical protein